MANDPDKKESVKINELWKTLVTKKEMPIWVYLAIWIIGIFIGAWLW